eukprot:660469-Amphidinium_carterae.1
MLREHLLRNNFSSKAVSTSLTIRTSHSQEDSNPICFNKFPKIWGHERKRDCGGLVRRGGVAIVSEFARPRSESAAIKERMVESFVHRLCEASPCANKFNRLHQALRL